MAEVIGKLKKARGIIKGQVTRAHNWLRAFDASIHTREEVEVRLDMIQKSWQEFEEKQEALEQADETYETDGERELFETNYYAASATARAIIARYRNQNDADNNRVNPIQNVEAHDSQLKLPPINLGSFKGTYEQWPSFRDTFTAMIDTNANLTDIKKLYYLRSVLKGAAADLVASIEMSADNYTLAWDLLKQRFENKRVLVHHHLQALVDFPLIQKEAHTSLRQLLDTTEKHVRALKNLGQKTDDWGTILVHLMVAKFDSATKREWESKTSSREVATYDQLKEFTTDRCIMLEALQLDRQKTSKPSTTTGNKGTTMHGKTIANVATQSGKEGCSICKQGEHKLFHCPSFLNLTPQVRLQEVRKLKACLNCLKSGHTADSCQFGACRVCHKKHNTLLHLNPKETTGSNGSDNDRRSHDSAGTSQASSEIPSASLASCALRSSEKGLLATAIVKIEDNRGEMHECRAFLDPGSQANFITSELCDRLGLPQQEKYLPIRGIQNTRAAAFKETQATIQSKFNAYKVKLSFSVLPEITSRLPLSEINKRRLQIPPNITLADPTFNIPSKIDVLLGSAIVWELLCVGQIKLGKNQPIAQKTKFGWIIAGSMGFANTEQPSISSVCVQTIESAIHEQLERFWHVEEGSSCTRSTENEKICEDEFVATHRRDGSGRFEVRLPLRRDIEQLGSSRDVAVKRFKAMERKFLKHPELKMQYGKFMDEYQRLGHMTVIPEFHNADKIVNYLPHHAVTKQEGTTTKLRVVFDASCPTSTGVSLNDILRTGPTIQQDLLSILLRFRQYPYVITADVQKMYRQVLLQDDQRDLQRIVWRSDPETAVQEFRLNTVTYGLASAPFLASRCLHQLGIENREVFPEASEIINNDFYVDDLLTGGDSIAVLQRRKDEISQILSSAGFVLHKWNTNEPSIFSGSSESTTLPIGDEIKTLGVSWNTKDDQLQYKTQGVKRDRRATKRSILSTVAQIYDPLGLMGPTIVCAKIILQQLWQLKVGWDESLPINLHTTWMQYQEKMDDINSITIPRKVICSKPQHIEMHGFCDASEAAYGACIYIRSISITGQISARLLCAKSKVAPLKRVTLPRLELCGALLLTRLGQTALQALSVKIDSLHYWSDSTITLAWIKRSPAEMQTFVANRVAEIQQNAPNARWRHVKSQDNPADIISRGVTPSALGTLRIWWEGPAWLTSELQEWPNRPATDPENIPELKRQNETLAHVALPSDFDLFGKFSSLDRLNRVIAYCLRFKTKALKKQPKQEESPSGQTSSLQPPTVRELERASLVACRIVQATEFAAEYRDLKASRTINSKSKLITLNPFLDSEGVLRVGGRLRHAEIGYSQRHPILLPAKHQLTDLIVRDAHLKQLHLGAQGLLAYLRQTYWILTGRQTVRRILRQCVVCFRVRPNNLNQQMGDLPDTRVTPSQTFLHSGLDYAGPFSIKLSRNKTGKAYLCVFVCCATKAVHLEIVSELSTNAFLNSLKRFIARRGRCATLSSDNGSNFVGANNELRALTDLLKAKQETIDKFLADQAIQWFFIPPYSPHMGGLWEAAVKSAKTHLKKVVGNSLLTFEELSTILAQIEAVLNSRPLCPISDDPLDDSVLTPGHFLVGEPLNSFPEPDLADVPVNRLTRFQLLSQMRQHFWTRWSQEYLTQLQNRYKWQQPNYDVIKIGALVLLKDDGAPPLNWRMARIVELHRGSDNHVRVVSLKTSRGTTKRAIHKICVLPTEP